MEQLTFDHFQDLKPTKSSNELIFARHDTFHPRFGWIKKGFDAVCSNPKIFLQEDAHIELGVGKNMAGAIRYWCMAFKVIEQTPGDKSRSMSPTQFGRMLLSNDGYDPFLEDNASLWLLHWNLLKSPCLASAWTYTFNSFRKTVFSTDDLFSALCIYKNSVANHISDSSIQKDVSCILRMYVEQQSKVSTNEENLDCPFAQLGLIRMMSDSKHYSFDLGSKPSLPAEIIVYACLEFASQISERQKTISISHFIYDFGSPGMIFKLPESAVYEAVEAVAEEYTSVALSDSAGLIQLSLTAEPRELMKQILSGYYSKKRGRL